MANGCMVPIRCVISIGIVVVVTLTVPLLPESDMEEIDVEKANIQSAGASPILT
jgi:hypothetical protein